jgi:23S rRNA pseudouridine1911/1915/1917 synthase
MLKRYTLKTTLEQRNQRLDQVLADWLPKALKQPVSKGKVRKLVVAGAVYLNGKRVRIASKELMPNATVDVYVDLRKLFEQDGRSRDVAFEMSAERILFEDEYILAVNKPPGLPTQPTLDEARDNLFASLKKFLAKRDGQIEPYLALHHRLDRDTSGVIVFAKAKAANSGVADMFSKHLARKTYHAICSVAPGRQLSQGWTVHNYLGRLDTRGKQAKYGAVHSGGDAAHTDFAIVEPLNEYCAWVEARPLTGRTHQIRVHLSEDGLPILGDALYGTGSTAPRVMLHAVNLTFPHPIHNTEVSIHCPLPEDFLRCIQGQKQNQDRPVAGRG